MKQNLLETVLLFASFYLPGMLFHSRGLQEAIESPGSYLAGAVLAALPQLLLLLYVLWLREQAEAPAGGSPWSRFGLPRLRVGDILQGAVLFAAAVGLLLGLNLLVSLLPAGRGGLFENGFRFRLGDWRLIPLALVFAVVTGYREELFFRGYLITRFTEMGIPATAAAGVGALLFALGHTYQGSGGFAAALILGVLFGLLFVRRRNLHRLAVAHALYNALVLTASLWAGTS